MGGLLQLQGEVYQHLPALYYNKGLQICFNFDFIFVEDKGHGWSSDAVEVEGFWLFMFWKA